MATNETIDTSGRPFNFKGMSYVALAPAVRQMGGTVDWDNANKQAHISLDGRVVVVQMANESVTIDGQVRQLTSPPLVIDGNLIVPQSFFGDALNRPL